MALQMSNTHPAGFEAPDAYWQAERLTINWETKTLTVPVRCYASAEAMLAGAESFDERRVTVPIMDVLAAATELTAEGLDEALYSVLAESPAFDRAVVIPTASA